MPGAGKRAVVYNSPSYHLTGVAMFSCALTSLGFDVTAVIKVQQYSNSHSIVPVCSRNIRTIAATGTTPHTVPTLCSHLPKRSQALYRERILTPSPLETLFFTNLLEVSIGRNFGALKGSILLYVRGDAQAPPCGEASANCHGKPLSVCGNSVAVPRLCGSHKSWAAL